MKISTNVLRRFVDVPADPRELRELLEDVGIEVKRVEGDVFTLELLANRGDHHCYAGIARELSGRTGAVPQRPPPTDLQIGPSPVPLRNETELCLVYTATLLERTGPATPLSDDRLAPLVAAGIHSVSPPVDATNLSNLELGQPTHAFDADTIAGGVVIRLSRPGETCRPLFSEARVTLPEGTLVIADEEKILAVAGVIGCEESKTTAATRRLLLESATFDPVAVRIASRALAIQTDSSARFERGSDPSLPLVGAGRVAHLLTEDGGWAVVGDTGVVGDWRDPNRLIAVDIPSVAGFLEHPITETELRDRLSRYGFTVSPSYPDWERDEGWVAPPRLLERARERLRATVLVRVPPHRLWDVEFPADLYEELAKSIGYNATPSHVPSVESGVEPTAAERAKHRVEEVLVGAGFYEVMTYGFHGRDLPERVGIAQGHPLWAHVETQNSLDRAYSLLKNNALLQALAAVEANDRMRHDQVKAFEWTRTFHPDPDAPNGVCTERRLLWAIASGLDREPTWAGLERPADVLFLKGVVREMAVELGLGLALGPPDDTSPLVGLLHPHRQARITLDGDTVGLLAEIHPAVLGAFKIRGRPCYLEIGAEALESAGARPVFDEPSEHHPIVRNLAFTLPGRVRAGAVADLISAAGPPFLEQVRITDLFEHTEHGSPVRTVTYELVYSGEPARTADEVNRASEYLVGAVQSKLGDKGVKLR